MQSLEFKDRLKAARKAKGWTMATLARKSGVTEGHISHCEYGKFTPRMDTLMWLAEALNVSMDWLAGRYGYDEENETGQRLQYEQTINEAMSQIDDLVKTCEMLSEQLNGLRNSVVHAIHKINREDLV